MRRNLWLAVSAVFALSASSAMAGGMQVDLEGVYANPTGDQGEVKFSDIVKGGIGGRVGLLWPAGDSLRFGVGAGYLSNNESDDVADIGGDLKLTSMPVHAILQWQSPNESKVGFYLRGGAGFTRHKLSLDDLDDSQSSFSYELGGGLSVGISPNWSLTGGASYLASSTKDGDVWEDGDDPKFFLFSVGLRYSKAN